MASAAVRFRADSGVAFLTLDTPGFGNALTQGLIEQLWESLRRTIEDPGCRVIVIESSGPDFCTGMDWTSVLTVAEGSIVESGRRFSECLMAIATARQPVIASVDGKVIGGGAGLVAACDIVIAAREATFALPEVVLGMIPALITPFLLRRMTPGRIRYLALGSRTLTAVQACHFGLVDEVIEDNLQLGVDNQLQRLLRSSPQALAAMKVYLDRLTAQNLRHQSDVAVEELATWLSDTQVIDGIRIFAEGLAPPWFQRFKGRGGE